MSAQVLPTAVSILSAARAHVETRGEVTSDIPTCSSSASSSTVPDVSEPSLTSPSQSLDTLNQAQEQDSQSGPSQAQRQQDSAESATRSLQSNIITPVQVPSSDPWSEAGAGAASPYFRSSRLWTISCNHSGGYGIEERATKKRRVAVDDGKPRWVTKIVLLGGCNSTTSTVHTIFHNIQPFSVVTGVTVVRDNLCHDILPEGKNNEAEWEECGSLSQLCYGCAATTAGTKAYVFGGKDANSQYLAEFQEFDMSTNTSKRLARGPQPKEDAVAVRIGKFFFS